MKEFGQAKASEIVNRYYEEEYGMPEKYSKQDRLFKKLLTQGYAEDRSTSISQKACYLSRNKPLPKKNCVKCGANPCKCAICEEKKCL